MCFLRLTMDSIESCKVGLLENILYVFVNLLVECIIVLVELCDVGLNLLKVLLSQLFISHQLLSALAVDCIDSLLAELSSKMVACNFWSESQITNIDTLLLQSLSSFLIKALSYDFLGGSCLVKPQTYLIRILLVVMFSWQ